MFTNEQKKQILEGFIDIIATISDRGYQKRIWVNGEGPEVYDFDDAVNDFATECSILENYRAFEITDNQYQILKEFRDKFMNFVNRNSWPSEFIDTPEWNEITEMAKEVLKAFNRKTKADSSI